MSMCNCNQGRLPCTCKTAPRRAHHPLANIAEWRKGCSCAPKESPVQCEACTEGLILAVENWFTQHRSSRILGVAGVLEDLDARAGLPMTVDAQAAAIVRHLEAELYAVDDQVTGLQELMAAQRAPESLDTAVRYPVAQADADGATLGVGSPEHGHNVRGRWDGDSKHPKGSLCEECAAWDALRKYAATDIVAEAQVIEEAHVTQPVDLILHLLLLPIKAGSPKEAVLDLGIRWEMFWGNPVTSEVRLLGCTNVPADLPSWLEVKK